MKKLIFLALICFVFLSVDSQTINMKGKNFDDHVPSGVAGDSVLGIAATEWTIRVLRDDLYRYDIYYKADTVVALANNMTVSLWGKHTDDQDYVQVGDSVVWYMTGADTTVRFNNVTNRAVTTNASHTETTAQHTRTTAAHVVTDTIAAFDIWTMDSVIYDDTLHVPQIVNDRDVAAQTQTVEAMTNTVAAQTLTEAEQRVGWGWLMVRAHCSGSTGKGVIERITVAILKDD